MTTPNRKLPALNGGLANGEKQKPQQQLIQPANKLGSQQPQQPSQTMSDADMKKACEKVIDAVRLNDLKKIKRYLTRYAHNASKIFTMPGPEGWSAVTSAADFGYIEILRMTTEAGVPVHWADGHGWLALHVAIFQGHDHLVKFFIEEVKTNVDYRSRAGWTALHVAVRRGRPEIVQLLLEEGHADVNVAGSKGWTALHLAAAEGRLDLLEILLGGPGTAPDVAKITDHGATPIYVAAQNGHAHIVKAMSFKIETISVRQAAGWAPIHIAAACGHESVVGILLEQSAFVDFKTAVDAQTPLYLASENGHAGIVAMLLDRNADVELATKTEGWTPMAAACARGRTAVVRLLKTRGRARLDVLTTDGETPLFLAAAGNHRDVIKELVEGNSAIDVNHANSDGMTALFAAVRHNSGDVIDMLLAAGADITASDSPSLRTVLHLAARDNHASAIQRLLDALALNPTIKMSAILEARDSDGATPVHTAAQYGAREALVALKLAGADVNTQTNDGRTPLFLAAHSGHKKVVELLLQYGVDVNLSEFHNWTPLHAAAGSGHVDVVDILLNAEADIGVKATDDTTCLYLATYKGYSEAVVRLLDAGAKINARTTDGWTPLHASAETGNVDMARLLLTDHYEADVLATSKTGDTPLHVAARWGHAALVALLAPRHRTTFYGDNNDDGDGGGDGGDVDDQEAELRDSHASGNDIDEPNNVGYSPLRLAARFGHFDAVKALLEAGADAKRVDPKGDGSSSLHIAARSGHARVVRLLSVIDRPTSGLDDVDGDQRVQRSVDVADNEGWTPVHWAASEGYSDVLEALIEAGADVDVTISKVPQGRTVGDRALHLAVRKGHDAAVRVLVEVGHAAVDELGIDGQTALRISLANKSDEITQVLLKNGASTDI